MSKNSYFLFFLLPRQRFRSTIQLLSNGTTFPDASTVINFGETIPASLSCPGEVDSYAFFALSGDAINALMSTENCGDVDPHIRLFDPNGEMLCEAKVNDTVECTDDDLAEILSCILPIDGVYVLLASDVDGNESGDYGINLSCISAVCGTSTPSPTVKSPSINSFNPTSATTGDTVVITGENFTGATAVSFGGTPAASFIVNTDTQISAVVGSGSSGNVTVTTPDGTASRPGFVFISMPEPPVVIPAAPVNLPRTGQLETFHAGDDGDIQAGVPWPDPRFTDNGDGTLTDNLTGLMWLKDGGCLGQGRWEEALNIVADLINHRFSLLSKPP